MAHVASAADLSVSTTGTSISDKMANLVRQVQDAEVELNNFTAQVGGPQAGDKQRAEDLLVAESGRRPSAAAS